MKPLVAIVGRPNVGKSTLFNRLIRRRVALVEDVPGVTRDRHYADAEWGDRTFTVIDTGGFVPGEKDSLLKQVREQAQLAVEECDVILFVTDGRDGLTAADEAVGDAAAQERQARGRRRQQAGQPVRARSRRSRREFFRLGLGEVFPLSAEHGLGVENLVGDAAGQAAAQAGGRGRREAPPDDGAIRMAIIGRPNVGKSTLVNALLKQKRVVASEIPGTTRDPIDSDAHLQGQEDHPHRHRGHPAQDAPSRTGWRSTR